MAPVIVGSGLVSPLGLGVAEHAFFLRASVGAPPPPGFETAEGERIDAWHCGFLGLSLPMADRLSRLVEIAARQALSPWEAARAATGAQGTPSIGLAFVGPRRAGIHERDASAARSSAARRAGAQIADTLPGAAGAFAALAQARSWLSSGRYSAVLIVGVDSFAHPDALAEEAERKESYWCPRSPPPSEGAAAVLIANSDDVPLETRREAPIVLGAATAMGRGNDEDDAILDGVAMTSVLRELPGRGFDLVVGQEKVDDLRARDFDIARARTASRFREGVEAATLEDETGRLGAAAGVAAIAYASGLLRHRIFPRVGPGACALAWAISADGTRGAALLQGGSA